MDEPTEDTAAFPLRPNFWRVAWAAVRPQTLSISVSPVAVGTALAYSEGYGLSADRLLLALCCALLIQIATNLHNDAMDGLRGADTAARLGPLRVTAAGWASAGQVLLASRLCLLSAFLIGMALVWAAGWPIAALGLASLMAAWSYSGGKRPLSHSPWGELVVLVFFGWVAVVGSHWLQSGQPSSNAWLAGTAVGLPAAAVLLINNLRDLQADLIAGRRTLASRLSPQASLHLHAALLLLPYLFVLLLAWPRHPAALLACASAPLAVRRIKALAEQAPGRWLNAELAATARLALLTTTLLCAGLLWSTRVP